MFDGLRLGGHLTKLSDIFEAIELTRLTMPIGAGGGLDSLGPQRMIAAVAQLEKSTVFLKKFPRHRVTEELLKNAKVAAQLGRDVRVEGMGKLLDWLIGHDLAMDLETFRRSYD